MKSGTFTFVATGLETALDHARVAAGDKHINLMGGETAQQFLKAGLLDEIHLQIAPLLLGRGRQLFEHLGSEPIELERVKVIESPYVTHLHFRIRK
jgi:dihydrofolate reductase